jgi:hypothetical protein
MSRPRVRVSIALVKNCAWPTFSGSRMALIGQAAAVAQAPASGAMC